MHNSRLSNTCSPASCGMRRDSSASKYCIRVVARRSGWPGTSFEANGSGARLPLQRRLGSTIAGPPHSLSQPKSVSMEHLITEAMPMQGQLK